MSCSWLAVVPRPTVCRSLPLQGLAVPSHEPQQALQDHTKFTDISINYIDQITGRTTGVGCSQACAACANCVQAMFILIQVKGIATVSQTVIHLYVTVGMSGG